MRLSILWRIMEIEEGVIRRGRRPRRITPYEISIILHMIRKPNSITATTGAPQISEVTIAVQWYLASSRRSRNENLWEIVASFPFLRLSLARTYHAWLARFAHPNGELARRLISLCRVKVLLFILCFKYLMDLTRLTKHIPEATPVSFEQSRFSDWAPAGDSELGWWTSSLSISSWQNKSITGWLWATSRLMKPR